MVAHFTMRTYRVNQAFRFVEGIWLHRKSRPIRFFSLEKDMKKTCSQLIKVPYAYSVFGGYFSQDYLDLGKPQKKIFFSGPDTTPPPSRA